MEKLHRNIFSLALMITAVLALASFAHAQTSGGVAVTVTRGPHPAWEGKAAGDVQPFERKDEDLKTALLSQPVPDIWLEFAEGQRNGQSPRKTPDTKETIIKVTLPPDARAILKSFWEEALKFDYKEAFVKPRSAQESYDRDVAWSRYITASISKLRKVEIAAPDGRRVLSDKEAPDLIYFARGASFDLVKRMKEQLRRRRDMAQTRHPTTHSTGARDSVAFIENLRVSALCARPLNSGVRRLPPF
jgi:hypothetical protein